MEGSDWEEIVNRLPSWKEGHVEPSSPELGIRRLFRMAVHNQLFAAMARHPRVSQYKHGSVEGTGEASEGR